MTPGRRRITVLIALLSAASLAGCSSDHRAASSSGWADTPVTFSADGMTVYGTLRHRADRSRSAPAALLIAGSGPTDRNGNSTLIQGNVGTLQTLADWLSADGVASLRYDKLGTGQTGLGRYGANPGAIEPSSYLHEAQAGLAFWPHSPASIGTGC